MNCTNMTKISNELLSLSFQQWSLYPQEELPTAVNGRHHLCCAPLYGNYYSWFKQYTCSCSRGSKYSVNFSKDVLLYNKNSGKETIKNVTGRSNKFKEATDSASLEVSVKLDILRNHPLQQFNGRRLIQGRWSPTPGELAILNGQLSNRERIKSSNKQIHNISTNYSEWNFTSTAKESDHLKEKKHESSNETVMAVTIHKGKQNLKKSVMQTDAILTKIDQSSNTKMPHLYWKFVNRVNLQKASHKLSRSRSRALTPMTGLTGEGIQLWREFYRRCTEENNEINTAIRQVSTKRTISDGRDTRQRIAEIQHKMTALVPPAPPPVTPSSRLDTSMTQNSFKKLSSLETSQTDTQLSACLHTTICDCFPISNSRSCSDSFVHSIITTSVDD